MKYQDIRTGNGFRHITAAGEAFLTDKQLGELKDLWRLSEKWHPVDSLFEVVPEIEKHFIVNVNRLMMIRGWKQEKCIAIVGGIICDGTVK